MSQQRVLILSASVGTGHTVAASALEEAFRRQSTAQVVNQDVLRLYRARWQIELVFKRMKQLLRLNQIRSQHVISAEATGRVLLIAWALHENATLLLRCALTGAVLHVDLPLSSWLLSGLSLDLIQQQVGGTWTTQRLHACVGCLRRFHAHRRCRIHQETAVRVWLHHCADRPVVSCWVGTA